MGAGTVGTAASASAEANFMNTANGGNSGGGAANGGSGVRGSAGGGGQASNNSYIREGESINTNVTCPGATLALGLIYFASGDRLIGDWFAPPDSAYLLDSVRPDHLLLRTLARNLIMWRTVLPSQRWLVGQLSPLIRAVIKNDRVLNEKLGELVEVFIYIYICVYRYIIEFFIFLAQQSYII